jgi:nucleotide-binding universal stress UspA family protein
MGVFSKKILLATDGSEDAELAARTATEPAEKTGSELHVVYAQPIPLPVGPRPMILSSISSALTPVR